LAILFTDIVSSAEKEFQKISFKNYLIIIERKKNMSAYFGVIIAVIAVCMLFVMTDVLSQTGRVYKEVSKGLDDIASKLEQIIKKIDEKT
jgi:predicted PurR-regulated permease PerM